MTVYFEECAETVIACTYYGKGVNNVLGWWIDGGYTLSDLTALATVVDAGVSADYLSNLGTGLSYVGTTARGLTSPTDIATAVNTGSGNGTRTGSPLPPNASLCVTLRTAFTGRSARGRFYALPTTENDLFDGQTYDADYADNIVNFLTSLQTAGASAGWILSILSRRTGNADRAAGVHFDVGDINYRNRLIDSRRSRLASGH